jgi:amino acid transporter
MMSGRGLFVRESTGLVKAAGFTDVVSINIANMSVGVAIAIVGFTLASLPTVAGVNLVYASLIAALLAIPQVIMYTVLIRYVPRVGGDYVWLSRALGPRLAWLVNGLVLGFIVQDLAYYALVAIAGVYQVESILPTLGINVSFSTWLMVAIASLFFTIIVVVNILGTKYGIRLMTGLTLFSIISLVLSLLVLFLTPRPIVISRVESLLPSGFSYSDVASKYSGSFFSLGPTLMMLPFFAIFIYPWLNAGPAIASEVKGRNALQWNLPISFIIALLLTTLSFTALYDALGFRFTMAALSNSQLNGVINYWTVAMAASGNTIIKWIIAIGSVTWYLALLAYGAIVAVRYWFALAFDRVWPSLLTHLSPRFGSPIYAHLIDLAVTVTLITLAGVFYGTFTALYGATVGALMYFMAVGIGAVLIGVGKRLSMGRGLRATLTVSGALTTAVMAYLTYQFLAYPSIWGGNWLAYGVVAGAVVLGIVAYTVSRIVNIRRYGIDIAITYTEIPPE